MKLSLVLHFCCTQNNFSRKLVMVSFILAIPAFIFSPAFHLFSSAHRHCLWVTQSHIRNLVYPQFCSFLSLLGLIGFVGRLTAIDKRKSGDWAVNLPAHTYLCQITPSPAALGVAMTLLEVCAVCWDASGGVDVFWLLQDQSHHCRSDLSLCSCLPVEGKGKVWAHGSISRANTRCVSFLNTLLSLLLFIHLHFFLPLQNTWGARPPFWKSWCLEMEIPLNFPATPKALLCLFSGLKMVLELHLPTELILDKNCWR